MKLYCSVEKLKQTIQIADKMTGKNLTAPALQALLLIASGSSLKIRATNLNVGIEIEIPATIEEEGVVLVKGDVLFNVCSNLTQDQEVEFSLEHENLTLQNSSTHTVIKCLPYEEFPTLPLVEGESFEIKSGVLQEGIRSVYFCAATTDIKPEIASIFIYSEQNNLVFVATDSFRLAEKKIKQKQISDISKILIPYKQITDTLRVLELFTGLVRVSYTKNQLSLSGGGIYFTTRLIDGAFPDYRIILPKEEKTKVVVMKQELLNTLRLGTVFIDKFFQVSISILPDKKKVSINSKNSDIGSTQASLDAVIQGTPIEVSCNLRYFIDVFQSLSGDSVELSFTEPQKPIVVKSVHDTSFLYLLMPTNR